MATEKQKLGDRGKRLIRKKFSCLKCKRSGTLKPLIKNFKCADFICDFCGCLAQVKTNKIKDINVFPKSLYNRKIYDLCI
jgi:transcription elongation factor Elf1